ncbi:V-type ATP synthase subunit K [Sporanaerobacter sp. PP17-6a]|uniref:V-type ATP synthase subunit K n=1 Tax=Sporanaerobacter sp. PP17-6a TaxID=1891289 RepID=UPI00089FFED5|nr:V-type ATP synthase subunit K [Sporanaerobacter sp. PP17-6a]SCL90639.1 Sodium ATPase proteolipid component [Sporanaerobacter sp. PP17-6a]
MSSFVSFFQEFGGLLLALLAAVLSALMAGIGSARGVGIVGQASAGLVAEEPEKFAKSLILQVIPGTQGFYGFITALIIISRIGLLSGGVKPITVVQGLSLLLAAFPVIFVEYKSAIDQANTAAAGIEILAKRPEKFFNAVIYAVMVETYAVLALIVSVLMIVNINL